MTDADRTTRDGALARWLLVLLAAMVVATIGRPLVGLGSLHAADTLQLLDPWAQEAEPGFRPDNGTVSDTVDAVAPVRLAIADRAREGDLALWSTTQGGGAPLLGVPNTAMLSPLSLPWWLAPGHWAPALAKALQMLVAAGGMVLLLRRVGVSTPAALVGALAFANAGHLVVWTTWPQSNVAALVPWLFWAVDRAATSRRWVDAWPVPLVGAVMWLEGFPAITVWAHVLAGAYAVTRIALPRPAATPSGVARRATTVAGAMALGVAVAAVQLVPFGFRMGELDTGGRAAKAADPLPWESIGTLVVPDLLGASGRGVWYGPRNEVEVQAFVGVVVLLLAVVALAGNRAVPSAARRWLAFCTAGTIAVGALMWVGVVNDIAQAIPLVGGNQTGRLRGLLAFLLAGGAAVGFDALRRIDVDGARRLVALVGIGAVVALAAVTPAALAARDLAEAVGRDAFLDDAVGTALALAGAGLLLVVAAAFRSGWVRTASLALLPVLLVGQSTAFARDFLPRIDTQDFYPRTAAHDVLADLVGGNRFAVGDLAMYPGTTTAYGLRSLTAHASMPPAWKALLTEVDEDAFAGNSTFPMLSPTLEVASSPVLDRLGVTHFVTSMDEPVLGIRDDEVHPGSLLRGDVPIHGVDVHRDVLDALEDHDLPVDLVAWVTDGQGARTAVGSRRLTGREGGEWLSVPLAPITNGAAPPTWGRLRVALDLDPGTRPGGDAAMTVSLPEDLRLRPVRVGPEGLRIVAAPDVVVLERPDALPRIRVEDLGGALAGEVTVLRDDEDEIRVLVTSSRAGARLVVADAVSGGHRATVDGEPVDLVEVGAFVVVPLPQGDGPTTVGITWQPEGLRPAAAITVLALLAVWGAALVATRRPEDGGGEVVGAGDASGEVVAGEEGEQLLGAAGEGVAGEDGGAATA